MQLGVPVSRPGRAGPAPSCPVCKQNDRVEKASAIYMESMAGRRRLGKAGEDGNSPARLTRLPVEEASRLGSRLAPPAAPSKVPVRQVHPDLAVAAFTAILPFFIAGIARSQRQMLVPILIFVALAYGLYFLTRRRILERFDHQKAEQQAETRRIEKAIGVWMRLHYCATDEILFLPGSSRTAPVDKMNSLLFD